MHHHRTGGVQHARQEVLAHARQVHPERFSSGVDLPEVLDLPTSTWIDRPDRRDQA